MKGRGERRATSLRMSGFLRSVIVSSSLSSLFLIFRSATCTGAKSATAAALITI
jgi:hypothetical protein